VAGARGTFLALDFIFRARPGRFMSYRAGKKPRGAAKSQFKTHNVNPDFVKKVDYESLPNDVRYPAPEGHMLSRAALLRMYTSARKQHVKSFYGAGPLKESAAAGSFKPVGPSKAVTPLPVLAGSAPAKPSNRANTNFADGGPAGRKNTSKMVYNVGGQRGAAGGKDGPKPDIFKAKSSSADFLHFNKVQAFSAEERRIFRKESLSNRHPAEKYVAKHSSY